MKHNTVSVNQAIAAGADPRRLGVTLVKLVKPNGMEEQLWVSSKAFIKLYLTNTVMVANIEGERVPCVSISTTLPMQTHKCEGRYRSVVEVEESEGETDLGEVADAASFYFRRAQFARESKARRESIRNPKRCNPIALAKARKERRRRQDAHEIGAFAAWCCGGHTFEAACYVAKALDGMYRRK